MPGSVTEAHRVTCGVLLLGGTLTILELMAVFGSKEAWIAVVAFAPPVIACALAARAFAQQKFAWGVGSAVIAYVAQVVVAIIVGAAMGASGTDLIGGVLAVTAILFAVTGLVGSPVAIAGGVLGPRKDLEAGDAMLGFSGVWLTVLHTIALAAVGTPRDNGGSWAVLFAFFGMVIGVGAFGVFVARAIARRLWSRRVLRGELQGWRVRTKTDADELASLPPLYGSPRAATAVLERVEMGGVLYRSGLVAHPLATVRAAVTP